MIEMPLEYWNKLAHQIIFISSLLSGFSIIVIANLLIYETSNRITIYILKTATVAAGCFLATLFATTKVLMMTTPGNPMNLAESDFILPRIIGNVTFHLGLISLAILISLTGWTKSKSTGIFTTAIGLVTFLIILLLII